MVKGYEQKEIAKALDRAPSAICYEIKKNSVNGIYQPKKAHCKARARRANAKYQGQKITNNIGLREFVEKHLFDDQSPAAIAGRLKNIEKDLPCASKDSIYRYIKSVYGRRIEAHRKRRKKRRRKKVKSSKLEGRAFISERPKIIDNRGQVGHTETDFIVSGKTGKGVLLVVVCRKLRVVFLEKITKTSIKNVHLAFAGIKKRFPEMRTITTDNDILLQKHKELEKEIKVKIYFCHPYHAWEKGAVENVNFHIRKYIPKGSDISKCSKIFISKIEDKLNRRMLECLNYLTPLEALERYRQTKKR